MESLKIGKGFVFFSNKSKYEFQWGERHSMISAEYWVDSYGPYAFGSPKVIDLIEISENRYLNTYASAKMLNEWRKFSRDFLRKERRALILKFSEKVRKIYRDFFNKFQRVNLAKASNNELFSLVKNYIKILKPIANYFVVSQPEGLDAIVEQLQKELIKEKSSHLMSVLITPTVPDIIFREQLELSKIAKKKINKNLSLRSRTLFSVRKKIYSENKNILYNHALKHAWLFFNSYNVAENIRFLKGRLKEPFHFQKKILKMEQLRQRQETIFKGLKNKKIKEICLFLQKMSLERLEIKDCWAGAEFRFLPLFQEISKRIKVPFELMMASYTLKDFETALLQKKFLSKKQIQQRIKNFILWKRGQKIKLIENPKQIKYIIKQVGTSKRGITPTQIQGVSANPGKVIGKVRLVRSININQVLRDLKRFNKGDILVAWMTQPNMVPIVRKAAAIIADEGGITSHAAVIAREFNIPCIVGTKIATKILKDGDFVEVDANKGIIKKL